MSAVDTTELRNQIAERPKQGGGKTVKQIIQEQAPEIARALPGMVDHNRFVRLVLTELSRNPKLQECSSASLLGALMYAAGLGVEPGPLGHAYLVPFGREVTFILGYRGMLELARRSGEILDIQARVVYENDIFAWSYGLVDKLEHTPTLKERGPAIAYYGVARFKDGGHYFNVMSVEDVDKIRARSRAKNNGPWVTDYDAMARKTVIRSMAPYLPLSPEVATAFEQDERVQATFDPDAREALTITETPYEDPVDAAPALPAPASPAGAEPPLPGASAPETVEVEEPGPGADTATGPSGDDGEVAASSTQLPGPEDADEVDDPSAGRTTSSGPVVEDYEAWKIDNLLAELSRRKLSTSGVGKVLRARLVADDERAF